MNTIKLQPTDKQIEADARKKRIAESVKSPKANPTTKDLYSLMVDIAASLHDIK